VLAMEERVNQQEVEIDADLSAIIARRQPTARDLRLLIAISKTIGNLERVGDEAARIARTVQRLINTGVFSRLRLPVSDVSFEATLATASLRKALDAFARLDTVQALEVIKNDNQIDQEFEGMMRKLITYMMEDPAPSRPASTWCSWPRPSSASATTPRTWPSRSSTSSRARTCATTRSRRSRPSP
jgi:phosphate transport system protein